MSCSCNGTQVTGWVAPDGDYDLEPCPCSEVESSSKVSGDTRKTDNEIE